MAKAEVVEAEVVRSKKPTVPAQIRYEVWYLSEGDWQCDGDDLPETEATKFVDDFDQPAIVVKIPFPAIP